LKYFDFDVAWHWHPKWVQGADGLAESGAVYVFHYSPRSVRLKI
jgi:hypothetical protein